ncbi:hypothetical protein M9H77_30065 [Catharanthus roseus]|uniref:Uncharacterized protein n=1 Tax=Catharanthus roseus TaxID=4058 RepID=A0ACB9ZYE5_CATRO|nr:hypothetical protein M9H77_30065 [Catharanthus roseus]
MHGLLVQVHYSNICEQEYDCLDGTDLLEQDGHPIEEKKLKKKSGAICLQESLNKVVEVFASSITTLSSIRGGMIGLVPLRVEEDIEMDSRYPNMKGFLAPYKGERYHGSQFEHKQPRNAKELFNFHHSSLRC